MRSKKALVAVVLGALAATAIASGCKKSSESERREAENAAREADEKANEAPGRVIDEQKDYFAAVRREQLELRGRVQEAIDEIDGKLGDLRLELRPDATVDPRSKEAQRFQVLLDRREKLEADASVIDRSDERNWEQIKAGIERDLREGGPGRGRGKI